MAALASIVVVLAVLGLLVVGLANYWANTPHGRIKPIFAFAFRVTRLVDPDAAKRAIGAAAMDTPEQIASVRAKFDKSTAVLSKPLAFRGEIEDRLLANAPGGRLPVRIYTPQASASTPLPLLVYFHGGGFVVGNPDYTDAATRILAMETPAVVVSVDYRLAPESRFPAAVDDCEFAMKWCHENAESLGARRGPVAVAGDSAGGNLSAVVALRDNASGEGRVGLQVLIYPCTDASRTDRSSHVAFGEGFGLSKLDVEDCMRYYVPPGTDRTNPDLSPLHAKALAGLPRSFVITAGFDVLRDEGTEYVEHLRAAGVDVRHVNEPAMPHGFITMTRLCKESTATLEAIAGEIRAMA